MVLGIDEAGRGPALGPLVLAAVAVDDAAAARLTAAGVMDSKRFGAGERAHAARAALVVVIQEVASFVGLEVCDVEVVDAYASTGRLNVLERERARVLWARAALPAGARVVADGERLFGALGAEIPGLEARDGAEAHHVAVAAASLCAKVRRDDLFACIAARYAHAHGALEGGGYGNAATHDFARRFLAQAGALPPEARASWPWPALGVGAEGVLRVAPNPALGGRPPVRQLGLFGR
jgi:ribonuclease HII